MAKPMKIAVFEPHPSYGGGSERLALDVTRHLASSGHELFLLHDSTGTMLNDYDSFLRDRRQMPLAAFGWRTFRKSLLRARRVAREFRRWEIDLIFSADVHYLRFLAVVGVLARLPVVLHLGLPSGLRSWSERLAFRLFALGVAPSKHTAETWRANGWPSHRLHVIGNGVDTARFRPVNDRELLRSRLGLPAKKRIIVYVGRLVEEKGIRTLLTAFALLRSTHKTCFLVIVGANTQGSLDPWPEEASRQGLCADAVCFTGRRNNPEQYLAAADLAVVPSEWEEPFGLVVLEAMACRTPPVVSDRGILRELVGTHHPELVFAAGHADSLAERMAMLVQHDSRRYWLADVLYAKVQACYRTIEVAKAYEQAFVPLAGTTLR